MSTAYRLPRGKFKTPSFKSQVASANEPITTMVVNSLITSLKSGQQIPRGKPIELKGIAWDGGAGIDRVEVSIDLGASWQGAKLGRDLGRFSFREFTLAVPARERGSIVVMARATSRSGETQVERLIHSLPAHAGRYWGQSPCPQRPNRSPGWPGPKPAGRAAHHRRARGRRLCGAEGQSTPSKRKTRCDDSEGPSGLRRRTSSTGPVSENAWQRLRSEGHRTSWQNSRGVKAAA